MGTGASEEALRKLEDARRVALEPFGRIEDGVLSRFQPIVIDGVVHPWPADAIGRQYLIRREKSLLLVTDGISSPWDRTMHPEPPPWTFGFEAAIEVPNDVLPDTKTETIERSWVSTLLWAATD